MGLSFDDVISTPYTITKSVFKAGESVMDAADKLINGDDSGGAVTPPAGGTEGLEAVEGIDYAAIIRAQYETALEFFPQFAQQGRQQGMRTARMANRYVPKAIDEMVPGTFDNLSAANDQIGKLIAGELPQSVVDEISRTTSESAYTSGIAMSPASYSKTLESIGQASLAATEFGINASQDMVKTVGSLVTNPANVAVNYTQQLLGLANSGAEMAMEGAMFNTNLEYSKELSALNYELGLLQLDMQRQINADTLKAQRETTMWNGLFQLGGTAAALAFAPATGGASLLAIPATQAASSLIAPQPTSFPSGQSGNSGFGGGGF